MGLFRVFGLSEPGTPVVAHDLIRLPVVARASWRAAPDARTEVPGRAAAEAPGGGAEPPERSCLLAPVVCE